MKMKNKIIWGVTTLPPLIRISSSKFIPDSKSCGYCALIVASGFEVASYHYSHIYFFRIDIYEMIYMYCKEINMRIVI